MDKNKNYFEERNYCVNNKIKMVLKELPKFCSEFFVGIENRTSPLTRLNYSYDLKVFFKFLLTEVDEFYQMEIANISLNDLEKVESSSIEQFVSYLTYYESYGKRHSNSQVAKARKLASVRSMFKYFFSKNKLTKDVASKVSFPKLNNKPIVRLENNEVENMLDEVQHGANLNKREQKFHGHTKLRDIAIVSLFLGTGIRISELIGLNMSDIDFYNSAFIVTRKGGDKEILYFNQDVSIALQEYCEKRYLYLKEETKDEVAFFLSLQHKRISLRAVENLIKKYASSAAPLKHITPHKLRSTFGTNLYRNTGDIYVVAELLGHKDVNVTKKHYADTSDSIKRNAVNKIDFFKKNKDDTNNNSNE